MNKKDLFINNQKTTAHVLVIIAVVLVVLVPFSAKPFHMDDPMFLWTARHILKDFINFYGFDANWLSVKIPMPFSMKNPPLVSYYIALAASIFGWGERAIHLSLIVPALAAALGAYFLARRFSSMPLLASLISVITPVFVVSATTVMSDVTMLAFWCWAVLLWVRGAEKNEPLTLTAAGFLIAMSALTKYFGMSLIPLLAAYSIASKHRPSRWAPFMILPVLLLAGYQWATYAMYGRGLLFDAADYVVSVRSGAGAYYIRNGFTGLIFIGGSIISSIFFAPFLWSRRTLAFVAVLFIGIGIALMKTAEYGNLRWDLILQASLFAVAGISVIVLSIGDILDNRDSASLLLALWVLGTFVFASIFNWTISGRTILPLAPAAGMIFVRRMEKRIKTENGLPLKLFVPLIPALAVAVSVAWADYGFANSARRAAQEIHDKYSGRTSNIWFDGHWGFQYYMELYGGKPIDWLDTRILKGDIIVVPLNNSGAQVALPESLFPTIDAVRHAPSGTLATVSAISHAGFYSSGWGELPYAVGPEFEDIYLIKYADTNVDFVIRSSPGVFSNKTLQEEIKKILDPLIPPGAPPG